MQIQEEEARFIIKNQMYKLIEDLLESNTLLNIDPNELDAEERLEAMLLHERQHRASSKAAQDHKE